jgi:hypothetical protein
MRLLHIDLGNFGIVTDHVQAAMTRHLLLGKDVAARAQICQSLTVGPSKKP